MKCNNCEKEYSDGRFCPFCGYENSPPAEVTESTPTCVCSQCHQVLSDGPFCPFCGNDNSVKPTSDSYHCPNCETEYTGNFCPTCGQKKISFQKLPKVKPKKEKTGYFYAVLSALLLIVYLLLELKNAHLSPLDLIYNHDSWLWSMMQIPLILLLLFNKKSKWLVLTITLSLFCTSTLLTFLANASLCIVAIYACFPTLNSRAKVIGKIWFIPLVFSTIELIYYVIDDIKWIDIIDIVIKVALLLGNLFFVLWLQAGIHDTLDNSLPTVNRNCFHCRESIGDGRFCPVCGYDNGTPPHLLRFRWYRFLVAFGLFASIASGFQILFSYISRLIRPEYYYEFHSSKHELLIRSYIALMLALYLGYIIYALVVRHRLEHFKKGAPDSLNALFVFSTGLSIWMIATEGFIFRNFNFLNYPIPSLSDTSLIYVLLLLIGLTLIFVPLNYSYFRKREALFSHTPNKE